MPITPELSAEIGARLRHSRDDLLSAARSRIEGDPPAIGPNAHATQNEDQPQAETISHDEEQLADHDTALLHAIDAALGRLESGGYGICVECGGEIPVERLLATPTVETCIECQTRLEQQRARVSGRPPTM